MERDNLHMIKLLNELGNTRNSCHFGIREKKREKLIGNCRKRLFNNNLYNRKSLFIHKMFICKNL
jgi:hypothetical protein